MALLDWTPDIYHAADTDLLLWGMRKHPGNEDAVRNELQPSIDKTRCLVGLRMWNVLLKRDNVFYYPFKSTSYRSSAISNISAKLPPQKTLFVTLVHKTSLKSLRYICSNSQKYIVWGQNYTFFFYAKIIRILSKDHVPWRYFVNFLSYIY